MTDLAVVEDGDEVMSRSDRAVMAFVFVVLAITAASSVASAAQHAAVSPTATLTVLAPPVQRLSTGRQPALAEASMDLQEGDRVITGQGGFALVTFLDGSTVTIEPNSDVTIRQANRERSTIHLVIYVGKVWARVARLMGRESSLSLESNEYAATAHDGLIGAQESSDGTFVCWTRTGRVTLAKLRGRQLATLEPGQKATAAGLGRPRIEPFSVNASALEIVASAEALPLLQMPDGQRLAGFVAPDTEVNQVFGSLTAVRPGAEGQTVGRLVEVPAGQAGPYRLVLTGVADGPYQVTIIGRHRGVPTWRHVEAGTIKAGEQAVFSIQQRVDVDDPLKARALRGAVVPVTSPMASPGPR